MRRGIATNTSMKFRFEEVEWDEEEKRLTVTGANLDRGDVSIVTHGANPASHLRSAEVVGAQMREQMRDMKRWYKAFIDRLVKENNELRG